MNPTENFKYKIKNCKKQEDYECVECNKGYSGSKCTPDPIDNCVRQKDRKCYQCRNFYRLVNNKCIEPPMEKECYDKEKNCQSFVRDGKCQVYKNVAEKLCKRSCNLCPVNLNQLMYYKNYSQDQGKLSGNLKDKYQKIYNDSIELKDDLLYYFDDYKKVDNNNLIKKINNIEEEKIEDLKLRKLNESLYQREFYLEWDEYIKVQDKNRDRQEIISDRYMKQNPEEILSEYKQELDEYRIKKIKKIKSGIINKEKKEKEEDEMRRLIEDEELEETRQIELKHAEEEDYKRELARQIQQEEEDEMLIKNIKLLNLIQDENQDKLKKQEMEQKLLLDESKDETGNTSKLLTYDENIYKKNKIKDEILKKEKIRQEKLEEEALDEQNRRLDKFRKKEKIKDEILMKEKILIEEENKKKNKIIEEEINKQIEEQKIRAELQYEEEEQRIRDEKNKEELARKLREAQLRKEKIMIGLAIALFVVIILILYRFVLKKK